VKPLVLIAGLSVFVTATAPAADPEEPFLVGKRDFKKQFRTIALTPVDADAYLEMPDSVAAILEQEVTARLKKRGYGVIPSSVLAEIRRTMEEQVGGLKDSATGQVDIEKAQAVRTHAFRELWFQNVFDALANIRVSITKVPMESDRVEWDGAKQKIEHEGRSKKYAAQVAVSSVSVAVYDAVYRPLYLHYGGLEPLMYRTDEQLEPLPADKLFLDEKKIREAAKIAVDPF
jgi:hypothetical protein